MPKVKRCRPWASDHPDRSRCVVGENQHHATSSGFCAFGVATVIAAPFAAATPAAAQTAEVIHWWTSGGKSAAVKVFADQFAKAGGTWKDTAIAGGANARTAAINRTDRRQPAHRHAVQHRQAVRRTRRERHARQRRRRRPRPRTGRHHPRSDPRRRRRARATSTRPRRTSTARTGCSIRSTPLPRPAPAADATGPTCSSPSTN